VIDFRPVTRELEGERFRLVIESVISRAGLNEGLFQWEYVESVMQEMVLRLVAEITATRPAFHVVEYPATWWEAFKARWFPRWALKRWPVKLTTVRVEARALLPDIPPQVGRQVFMIGVVKP
jgi:hypothetical protein